MAASPLIELLHTPLFNALLLLLYYSLGWNDAVFHLFNALRIAFVCIVLAVELNHNRTSCLLLTSPILSVRRRVPLGSIVVKG